MSAGVGAGQRGAGKGGVRPARRVSPGQVRVPSGLWRHCLRTSGGGGGGRGGPRPQSDSPHARAVRVLRPRRRLRAVLADGTAPGWGLPTSLTRSRGAAAVAARLARAAAAVDLPADGTAYAPEARRHAEQPVGRPVGGGARGGARGADGGCGEDGRRDGVLPTDGESA